MFEDFILSGIFLLNNKEINNIAFDNIKDVSYFNNKNIIEFKQEDLNKKDYFSSTKINRDSLGMETSVKSGIMFNYDTGEILWSKNEDEVRSIASLTKIMTMMVFLDGDYNLNKYIEIKQEDLELEMTQAAALGLRVGDEILVNDLLKAALIGSKNDAVNVLVRYTGMTEDEFIRKMNEKAKFLGLKNTRFDNVNGLSEQNKSTAKELSKLYYYAFFNNTIRKISTMDSYTFKSKSGKSYTVKSTDKLLNNGIFTVLGGKTGYIDDAGYCFASLTQSGGRKIIGVFLGSESDDARFFDAKVLNWWAYKNFKK